MSGAWRVDRGSKQSAKAVEFMGGYGELFAMTGQGLRIKGRSLSAHWMPNYLYFAAEVIHISLRTVVLTCIRDATLQSALVITIESSFLVLFAAQLVAYARDIARERATQVDHK